MKVLPLLQQPIAQAEFAELVGYCERRVRARVRNLAEGKLA